MAGRFPRFRRGTVLIQATIVFLVVAGICTLGVDVARVRLAKSQMLIAADAASRAAMSRVPQPSVAKSLAASFGMMNKVDGKSITIDQTNDIEFGKYDPSTKAFTVLASAYQKYANAIRVTVHKDTTRNGAISMTLPGLLGQQGMNLSVKSMSYMGQRFFGIVGLDSVKFTGSNGACKLDSYDSVQGAYNATTNCGDVAAVASNGNISLGGNSTISGEAHAGGTLTISSGSSVSGSTTPLPFVLNYPAPVAGSAATTNDNANVPGTYMKQGGLSLKNQNTSVTIPGGTYYWSSIDIAVHANLYFSGPAVVYVNGSINIAGTMVGYNNNPSNLYVKQTAAGTVTLSPSADIYASFYCPLGDVTSNGTADYYGCIIAKTLTFSGGANLHFDENLGAAGLFGSAQIMQ